MLSLFGGKTSFHKQIFAGENSFYSNPLFQKITENKDDLKILFLEHGIRDSNGIVPESGNYHLEESDEYKYCADCTIILYGDFQLMIDCGLGMKSGPYKSDSSVIKNATDQIIDIMASLLPEGDAVWDAMIFTHKDADHIYGAPNLMKYS